MKDWKIITENAQETQKIAGEFMSEIIADSDRKNGRDNAVLVCLWGDLGSGKTTFTQGLAKELGIRETVNSPTFLIMKKYNLAGKNRRFCLYHFDLYRIKDRQEILDLGWKDIVEDENNLVVVEWPEKIAEILPEKRIDVEFASISENKRSIVFHFL